MHPKRIAEPNAKPPSCSHRGVRDLLKRMWDAGCWVEKRKKHYAVYPPNDGEIVVIQGTPGDHRWKQNAVARLRRADVDI